MTTRFIVTIAGAYLITIAIGLAMVLGALALRDTHQNAPHQYGRSSWSSPIARSSWSGNQS